LEVIISNASKRNCLTAKMMLDLARIVDEEIDEQQQLGLILRGVGRQSFCAGLDLSLAKSLINDGTTAGLMQSFMSDALMRIRKSALVSVCIINAGAIGGQ
jgi:enoyl-CoA hydratase/carnithine racemase